MGADAKLNAVQSGLRSMSAAMMKDIKILRGETHRVFDQLWKDGWMSRTEAYVWLARSMHLPREKAHIEQFTHTQCYDCMRHTKNWLYSQVDFEDDFDEAYALGIYGDINW